MDAIAGDRSGHMEKARQFAEAVRRIAGKEKLPLIDYFSEILKRRPDDWDGSLPQFKALPGDEYQVPKHDHSRFRVELFEPGIDVVIRPANGHRAVVPKLRTFPLLPAFGL